ncbi:MAG: hypothetical protein F2686_05310, partial [Actinobacteria bacterium]|nr:hypothetical protein [Actinomycetota bacterium]
MRTTITPDGTKAYVTNDWNATVSVINTATNTVSATIPVGRDPFAVAITPDGTKAYVTNASETVSVIDTATNTVIAAITLGGWGGEVVITPDGTKAYVIISDDATVSVINTATNTVSATITVGGSPGEVVITPDGTKAYVTNFDTTVSVIDTATDTVSATINVGNNSYRVAVTPDGTKAYVTNFNDDTVSVIDTATGVVSATIPVGDSPGEVAITPDGTKAYVTNYSDATVSVIDTATDTVSATIPVGKDPQGVAVTPDGTKAYVANLADDTVSVINTAAALADPVDLGPTIIDDLVAKFMIDDEWIVIGNRGFDWWGGPLPLAIQTSEPTLAWGDLTVRVAATCTVVEDVRIDEDDAINLISSLTFATSGQLMGVSTAVSIGWAYDPATRSVTATTVGYFHEGNLGVLITYSAAVLLRYDEALRMAFELAKQLQGTVPQRPHPSSGLRSDTDELLGFTDEVIRPAGTDLNRYGLNDFEA